MTDPKSPLTVRMTAPARNGGTTEIEVSGSVEMVNWCVGLWLWNATNWWPDQEWNSYLAAKETP